METLAVTVFTHGSIPLDESKGPVLTQVPAGMTVTKVSAVVIGICNMMFTSDAMKLNDVLIAALGEDPTPKKLDEVIPVVREMMSNVVVGRARDALKYDPDDETMKEFIRHPDIGFSKIVYTEGQSIIDKLYARTVKEVRKRKNRYDYRINALNMPGIPDLYAELVPEEPEGQQTHTYMHNLLELLSKRGVKHLLLFDFSCSAITDQISDREVRALRRDTVSRGLNGGRRKTRRKRRHIRKGRA